ncbi:hypothetical protein MHZ92_11630 [Sporosarcina sp. ACRSL]|uniref:hypothetical protein n=1 Tax=Sporosarcina sp. ACRSL TaxID=2918215 RepID=UPI001EF41AFB|nr:hypothetical protein [Sporosarcina sp. ACRSL]MCG7344787.1 hypothetical protein [Sporosarcina sp. ACRSL]
MNEVIEDIRKIELKKALTIISNYSLYGDEQKKELVKRLIPYIGNSEVLGGIERTYLFGFLNLNYSLKMFIAYGLENPVNKISSEYGDFWHVLITIMKISDLIEDDLADNVQLQQTIQKMWLVNRERTFMPTLARQQIFFGDISTNPSIFGNEFINIHQYFEDEYGYTIQEYISVLTTVCAKIETTELNFEDQKLTGIPRDYFNTTNKREVADKIIYSLTSDLTELKVQAKKSLNNFYDNEYLINSPFFEYDGHYVLFSPPLLNLGLFDGLCFKLQKICSKYKKDFFTFFGRLFEKYVEFILSDATQKASIPYQFLPEYQYATGKNSSDSYIKLGKNLLIIECKGGRITKNAKINADLLETEENFLKYVINPINQASAAYTDILKLDPDRFSDVKKVYILSVGLQRFPKLPMYHERLKNELVLHQQIKHCDYLSLSDLEVIATYIERQKKSLFKFIDSKMNYFDYYPYDQYYAKKYGEVHYFSLHKQIFSSLIKGVEETLREN